MQKLELIAGGGIDAAEARGILNALPREIQLDGARRLFVALRAWTWKALDQKRRDPELREWHDVIKRAQVRTKGFDRIAAQLQVLLDLVHESIVVAIRRPVSDVLKRRNAKAILVLLRDAPEGRLTKQALMIQLGLKDANLSRLMNVLAGAGLVERTIDGREAQFRLSREGLDQAAGLKLVLPLVVSMTGRPGASHIALYGSGPLEERAKKFSEQLYALLGEKLTTNLDRKSIVSFDRPDLGKTREMGRCVRAVGAAYYGDEHNLFGDPTEIAKLLVVGRSVPDRYSGYGNADNYEAPPVRLLSGASHG